MKKNWTARIHRFDAARALPLSFVEREVFPCIGPARLLLVLLRTWTEYKLNGPSCLINRGA